MHNYKEVEMSDMKHSGSPSGWTMRKSRRWVKKKQNPARDDAV